MRDPNRLDKYYEQLCELHKQHCPDWRMGQLMYNFLCWYSEKYGDPFFQEDAEFKAAQPYKLGVSRCGAYPLHAFAWGYAYSGFNGVQFEG
jgi:hypothetical protein